MRIFTDLDLNSSSPRAEQLGQATPVRVHPRLGEWGPDNVPTTRAKKRQRVLTIVVFLVVLSALCALGWYFYRALNGML